MKRHLIGPVLGWEIVRLGRRGNATLLRIVVGLVLFLALFIYYLSEYPDEGSMVRRDFMNSRRFMSGPMDMHQMMSKLVAEFAEGFNKILLFIELGLVLLLTPVYICGSLAEERDRKTLEFLLATDLSSWEIIVGKLGSRLFQLSTVLLLGIPIIAFTQVWGGVDILLVGVAFGVFMLAMLSTAAFCAWWGLYATTFMRMLVRCYIPIVLFHGGIVFLFWKFPSEQIFHALSPVTLMIQLYTRGAELNAGAPVIVELLALYAVIQILATCIFLFAATCLLRKLAFRTKKRKIVERKAKNPEKRHWADPPVIPEESDGLYWKEKYFSGSRNRFVQWLALLPTWLWIAVVVTLGMVLMAFLSSDIAGAANLLTKFVGILFLFMLLTVVGMAACASVARERQKETIVDLVMIPGSRKDVLDAKWWGSLAQGRSIIGGFFALCVVGALCLGISFLALPGMLLLGFVWSMFAVSLGLWLSVRCRSVQRASAWWIALMLVFFGGTYLGAKAAESAFEIRTSIYSYYNTRQRREPNWIDDQIAEEMLVAFAPTLAWDRLTFDVEEQGGYSYYGRKRNLQSAFELVAPAFHLLLCAMLITLLWHLSWRQFRDEIYK